MGEAMHIESEYSKSFEELDHKSKEICQKFIQILKPVDEPKDFTEINDLYGEMWPKDLLYVVTDGCLCFEFNGQILFHFDEGDMIGLLKHQGFTTGRYFSEQYVQLQAYRYSDLEKAIKESEETLNLWNAWQASNISKLIILYSLNKQQDNKANLGFGHYKKGDVIIKEGDPSTEVYAIVDGQADVMVMGVKVGEVYEEEIFGAMSLLTNSPRSATVVATKNCTVLIVPRDEFNTLMKTHPHICINLLESLAKKIVSLNEQVLLLRDTETQTDR